MLLLTGCMNPFMAGSKNDPRDTRPWSQSSIGEVVSKTFAAPDPELRLLTSYEYHNTIEDLLGLSSSIDENSGTVMGSSVHENLLATLITEAKNLADQYIAQKASSEFPCYTSQNLMEECAQAIIGRLSQRAFRRIPTPVQLSKLNDGYHSVSSGTGSTNEGLKYAISRILISPDFLYRQELGRVSAQGGISVLDDFERASLLSYAVTGSMPDSALFADAQSGSLDSSQIRHHVRRLLKTAKGRNHTVRFYKTWLRMEELDRMAAEPDKYPKFTDPQVVDGLQQEFSTYITSTVLDNQANLRDLLTLPVTFANQHTAPLYGVSVSGSSMVEIRMSSSRKGVLGLASFMAVHSSVAEEYKDRPVGRGLVIKNQFLCERVGIPSGISLEDATNNAINNEPNFNNLTVREQFEVIMDQDQGCVSCHSQFMPYGYVFSNFDALGRETTSYKGRPINSTADVTIDRQVKTYSDSQGMIEDLVHSPSVHNCLTRNLVQFSSGAARDDSRTEEIAAQVAPYVQHHDYALQYLVEDVLASPELYVKGTK